jgi:ESS family glutamate:Na+ symporter
MPHVLTLSAWWLLAAAIPVLLLGQGLLILFKPLARFDLPVPVVGGIVVAVAVLAVNVSGKAHLAVADKVSNRAWTWLVTPEVQWIHAPSTPVYLVFSTIFFTCVGLCASWSVARRGGWLLLLLLAISTLLAVLQNVLGVAMCRWMGQSPLLGLICGSVTMTGGPSTALGFAERFEKAGFPAAAVVGAAAAMFGIVIAGLISGAFGGQLIRRLHLRPARQVDFSRPVPTDPPRPRRNVSGIFQLARELFRVGQPLVPHLLILLLCIKVGAWISYGINSAGISMPVYMGALLLGVLVRNVLDAAGMPILRSDVLIAIGNVSLWLFLAMAMAGLDLMELRRLAVPMLAILWAQVVLMLVFALGVTFMLMGRDYDAAVAAAGHVGYGLGITPNAVAAMDVLEQKFGPSPRAVLAVTIVGAFLIDITNSIVITVHLKLLK